MDALASGYAKAFPRSKRLTAAERARAFGEALGEPKQNVPARTFGVPNRAYEVTQERSPRRLAGVVAARVGAAVALSRRRLHRARARVVTASSSRASSESIFASLAVYASTSSIAARRGPESARRRLSACCAWFALLLPSSPGSTTPFTPRDVARTATFFIHSASSTLSALCARRRRSSRARRTVRRRRSRDPGPIPRTIAWCVAACATAPGNVGLVHIAVVLTHLSSVFPVASASAASAKKRL